jgi:hypothetical protein
MKCNFVLYFSVLYTDDLTAPQLAPQFVSDV